VSQANWKIEAWKDEPDAVEHILPQECPDCGHEGFIPTRQLEGATLESVICDDIFIFDPPEYFPPSNWLPDKIACPNCGCSLFKRLKGVVNV
jgi:hypothetical protein